MRDMDFQLVLNKMPPLEMPFSAGCEDEVENR
jgi:hypothetical protein